VSVEATLASVYRQERQRIFATLVRLLGGFDAAEEALHDAFVAAAEQWPDHGVPANPVAWLVSTGRFRAIDRMRRDRRAVAWDDVQETVEALADDAPGWEEVADAREAIEDDRLRLVFTCCHPSLAEEARIALTLREVCGLTTEAIAAAFLVATPALAQRIVRAKAKIAAAGIPYEVPEPGERPARLASVLRVVYLVFNEAQGAHAEHLAEEAIRLTRLLRELLPEPEVEGLLALQLLHGARRAARRSSAASSCRSKSRTGVPGTAPPSPKARHSPSRRCRGRASAPMRCRRRSRRCTARRRRQRRPTGRRSSASTTRCSGSSRAR
jgi:RNA polymerase sigma-70 factor (ECF subfamily)